MGAHTVWHPELPQLSAAEREQEMRTSKEEIEARLGRPVRSFAHPYAFPQERPDYVRWFGEALRRIGYTHAVTTRVGRARPNADPFVLPRLPVNDADDTQLLVAKLEGAYDWVGPVQALVRRLRRGRSSRRRSTASIPAATTDSPGPKSRPHA
jgi:peptidoglycan/xylan/chitin deacetylase (PgdA/CDA1 family)